MDVIARHVRNGKALLEAPPHLLAVERDERAYAAHGLIDITNDEPRYTIIDDFGHRPFVEGKHGRAARHRFDHREAKRLGPIDREKQPQRIAQECRFLALVDFANELHAWLTQQRFDLRSEVGVVGGIDFRRYFYPQAGAASDCDGTVNALLRRNPP